MSKHEEKRTSATLTDEGRVLVRGNDGVLREEKGRTDWQRLVAMEDDAIDYTDSPELTEEFWKNVRLLNLKARTASCRRK